MTVTRTTGEGDLAQPNVYFQLPRPTVDRKIEVLMECFPSQHSRQWFDQDLFATSARICGHPLICARRLVDGRRLLEPRDFTRYEGIGRA